jgi:2-C-methyl-D-erythritol 2,4-cyclodiphosphate synthase
MLLGACALVDIGKHFPDTDNTFKGISSVTLLHKVGKLVFKAGFIINNIDATIIAQKPKMLPHIEHMRENISKALDIKINQINIKATTEEGLGFTGEMLGISSQSIASVESINSHENK